MLFWRIPNLEKSQDKKLRDLAAVLKKICTKKNSVVIGVALKAYEQPIKDFFGNMLPEKTLKDRLKEALNC